MAKKTVVRKATMNLFNPPSLSLCVSLPVILQSRGQVQLSSGRGAVCFFIFFTVYIILFIFLDFVCLWRMGLPRGFPILIGLSPRLVKSLSETCEKKLHMDSIDYSLALSMTFPLAVLLLSLLHTLYPPFSPSKICSCAHLNPSNKGCRFRWIKLCVCGAHFYSVILVLHNSWE